MDMTILVQDFILPTVGRGDVHNPESINNHTRWAATDDELVFLTHRSNGKPAFEAGGVFFAGS
ncbi:hypothetical protein [Marinobacter orientalis]|uniref:Uncharacterized protein n=1 Tax=Marinobacter orientalis TaxID=1928859 RepID=A0A7Y0RC73_9GAMM|nr:hypothetical protein [Marinobacter orientalis]NMT63547.1 hypothetical protein [Marinobacter orientalis]TGX48603.1 hypothetical protein DIT72_14540 [Marinobacter orientalis]